MWPFKRKIRQRRLEVRKNIPSGRASAWRRFRQAGGVGSVLLAAAFLLALIILDMLPTNPFSYRLGQYLANDVRARVAFEVLDQQEQNKLLEEARNTTPPVFRLNATLVDAICAAIKNLPDQLKATTQPGEMDKALAERFAISSEQMMELREALGDPQRRRQYDQSIDRLRVALTGLYLVRAEALQPKVWRFSNNARFLHDNRSSRRNISELVIHTDKPKLTVKVNELAELFEESSRKHIRHYLNTVVEKDEPLYVYDASKTQGDIALATANIEINPPTEAYRHYAPGVPLARRSRRTERQRETISALSAPELDLLIHEHRRYLQVEKHMHPWRSWGRQIGRMIVLLLLIVMVGLYIAKYKPRVIKNHWRGLAIVLILLVMVVLARVMVFGGNLNPHCVLFPVMLATIVLTVSYDQRFALAMGTTLSAMIVLQLHLGFDMAVVLLAGVAATAFQLREIRTRTKLIEASAIVGAVVFVIVNSLGLVQAVPWRFLLFDAGWAAGMTFLAGLLMQAILPVIERVFGITTSMTLLEWCDVSRPLLKRLSTEASGTYNHSLQLGAMSETAANAIDARGLLARVGAYYHDIGKINKPAYFVENEAGMPSKHQKLSPAMSLLIIIGHVKDGLEMAREYNLPAELHPFIATHHGTTLVQFFYHAATEQRKAENEPAPEEVEFRYPGPKPRTKENGILMLADAAESSVRAMSQPTPGRIENQVHTMVNRRLMDGQLDECDMTLMEVHQVEASLIKSLCGIYHARIAYPTPPGAKPSAAEIEAKTNKRDQAAGEKSQSKASEESETDTESPAPPADAKDMPSPGQA